MTKQHYLFLPLVVAGSLVLTGCFGGSSSSDNGEASQVRVIHASPDAPAVNVTVDDDVVVEGANYKSVAQLDQDTGTYSVGIDAVLPDGSSTVLGPLELNVEDDTRYEVIAVGSVADESLDALVFPYSDETFESETDVRLRVAHLAGAAGDVDVYLSDPADDAFDIGEAEPNLSLVYGDLADPVDVPEGDYRIQVTAAGDDEVVFDSGAISLNAGDDLLLGAVTNTGANADASPISLLVVDGDEVSEIYDADQYAGVRVVHNSADASNVDLYLDGELSAITDLAFTEVAPEQSGRDSYTALPGDDVAVAVSATGQAADDAVIEADLALSNGQGYTIIAVGLLDDIEALVLEDGSRSIATQASLRVVHGSTQAGNVDVYLLEPGAEIGNAEPVLADVAFRDASDYLAVAEGDYDIVVAFAGAEEAFRVAGVTLDAGGVYTAIARDEEGGTGVADEFILVDDFTADALEEADATVDDAIDAVADAIEEAFE